MDILIVHDLREPAKKCSVTPLRGMAGIAFHPLSQGRRVDVGRRIWLHPDGDELSPADAGLGLLLIDCTWKRVATLAKHIDGELVKRRLPKLLTAYPRKSKKIPDPDPPEGLASVEALYAATVILGAPRPELLAGYHWSSEFLAANPQLSR